MALKKISKPNVPATPKDIKTWAYIFKVLGDEIRLKILKEIIDSPGISGKEIIINLRLTQPTLSFHLKQLNNAKIIRFVKDGQTHCYYANKEILSVYYDLVEKACELIYTNIIKKKDK